MTPEERQYLDKVRESERYADTYSDAERCMVLECALSEYRIKQLIN